MARTGIDMNRPKMMKSHNGLQIWMYLDQPGIYYYTDGTEASQQMAKLANYDIVKLGAERIRREKMAEIEERMREELDLASEAGGKVLKERNGYKLVALPYGYANVVNDDGEVLTKKAVTEAEAAELFDAIAGPEIKGKGKGGDGDGGAKT